MRVKHHGPLLILAAAGLIQAQAAAEEIPRMMPNHVFLVLDGDTYRGIAESDFLGKRFAVFEKRTTIRSDSRYSGLYFYGMQTYFEFLEAGESSMPAGMSGIAFGVDGPGDLERLLSRLSPDSRIEPNEVTRDWRGGQIPWFRMAMFPEMSGGPWFWAWIMEYQPIFLEQWHAGKPPLGGGIARRDVLRRYAAALDIDPGSRLLVDLIGLTAAADAGTVEAMKKFGRTAGYVASLEGTVTILNIPEFEIRLVPRSGSPLGIVSLKLRVRGMPEKREFRFGPGSILTFQNESSATWRFEKPEKEETP